MPLLIKKYLFLFSMLLFPGLTSLSQNQGTIKVKKTFNIVGTWYLTGQYNATTNRNITPDPSYFDTLTYYSDSSFIKKCGSDQNNYNKYIATYFFSSEKIEYINEKSYTYFSNSFDLTGSATTGVPDNILTASNDSLAFIYYFPNTNILRPEKVYYYKRVK